MNILSLSWFVRNMQSYHILTCRDKTGKIHIFFSHQHAWYPLLDMGISLLRIWCILFGSIFLSLLLPRIRDSSIFWKLTITKLNRSYSFLATLPLELVIIYRYIYISSQIHPNPISFVISTWSYSMIFPWHIDTLRMVFGSQRNRFFSIHPFGPSNHRVLLSVRLQHFDGAFSKGTWFDLITESQPNFWK